MSNREKPTIVIEVHQGIIEVTSQSKRTKLVILDYDIEEEDEDTKMDADGQPYAETIYET